MRGFLQLVPRADARWLASVFLMGCFATDLDPSVEGAFACVEDTECPAGQSCDGSRCVATENLPVMKVLNPEPGQVFPADGFPGMVMVNVQGNLELVEPSDDVAPGTGYVEVVVDGTVTRITSGPLTGGIVMPIEVAPEPGGHRISAVAYRPDGVRYANPEAQANTLFWIDNGEPHIALTRPWPESAFPLEATSIEVEVATLNFDMRAPEIMPTEGIGHAHVHYDDPFPACPEDTACDGGYIAVVTPPPGGGISDMAGGMGLLPQSAATMATLTAILRNDNHCPYFFPFIPPPDDGQATDCLERGDDGKVIFNTIRIARVADPR